MMAEIRGAHSGKSVTKELQNKEHNGLSVRPLRKDA